MNAVRDRQRSSGGRRRPRRPTTRRILLASEGRRFSESVIDRAIEAAGSDGRVRVLVIARMWGTGWGLPHPGLRPNKRELAVHEENVAHAIRRLRGAGLRADGHIIATRKPSKSILAEANRYHSDVIVMGADPQRSWLVRDFMWSQEPYRVQRRAQIPCEIVRLGGKGT